MKKFLLLAALFSVYLGAFNQTASTTNFVPALPNFTSCGDTSTNYILQGGFSRGNSLKAYVFNDDLQNQVCSPLATTPKAGTEVSITAADNANGQALVTSAAILNALGVCPAATAKPSYAAICIYSNDSGPWKAIFHYDVSPKTLNGISLSEGNKRITVTISDPNIGTSNYSPTYEVCFSKNATIIDGVIAGTTASCPSDGLRTSTSTSIVVSGLENGPDNTYTFTARVQGSANKWTASKAAFPIETDGFGEIYAKQGGAPNPLSFSCTQTSASPATWMLFLLLGLLLRRKTPHPISLKRNLPLPQGERGFILATLLFIAIPANADLGQINFGIVGSTYKPALDLSTKPDGSQIAGFYGNMFSDKLLPLMGVEVDVHLLDDFGSLQVGLGLAYAYAGGNAIAVSTGARSNDPAGLHMLHLKPQLTYILDPWVDIVPLAPYVRAGIVTMGYMFTYQGSIDREAGGANPMGFMFGYEAAAGLMLALDWLEPSVSKQASANGVYDHIYLKAEAAYMPINNFGRNGLNFSPAWPTPNFPMMLTFGLVFEFK